MGRLVIDEWVWEDLNGANGDENRAQALQFLRAVYAKCDQLVAVRPSAFLNKAHSILKRTDRVGRTIAKFVSTNFLLNSIKVHFVEAESLPCLSEEACAGVKDDDQYLVQALTVDEVDVFVTSDGPLVATVRGLGYTVAHRDEFVAEYIKRYGPP